MRDHDSVVIGSFKGSYSRGEDETVPKEFFLDSKNIQFTPGGFKSRDGTRLDISIGPVRRITAYKKIGEAQRRLILSNESIYDSTNLTTPILTVPGMTDFSSVVIFNRAYISPHDGLTGLENEKVYIYNGVTGARSAAGEGPSGTPLSVVDGAAGKIPAGIHIIGVSFQTESGFITKPGCFFSFTAGGDLQAFISSIPIGGAHVSKRVLLSTKTLTSFDGNFFDKDYFYIPNGTIEDNVATTATVDFYDADLQEDATPLLEQLDKIPAGVGIGLYSGRMLIWGEKAFPHSFRASEIGEPEAHNEVEGFATVNPGDSSDGIRNMADLREQLIIYKSRRTYGTVDNKDTAATWKVVPVDNSIGADTHGIGKILDYGEDVEDYIFVADQGGLRLFNGSYLDSIITRNIEDDWARINKESFNKVEIVLDPINFLIFIAVPLDDATEPNCVFYGDYSDGITDPKWTCWTFPNNPQSVLVDFVNKTPIFKYGSLSGNIYQLDPNRKNDNGEAIDQFVQFALMPTAEDDLVRHFTGIKVKVRGVGTLDVTAYTSGMDLSVAGEPIELTETSGMAKISKFGLTSDRCSVKLRTNRLNEHFSMTRFASYYLDLWEMVG